MITISGIIYGAITVVVGTLFVKYSFNIMNFTGRQDWIESKIGSGTTNAAYKFFGILLVLGGLLSILGLLHGVGAALTSPFKSLFPGSN